VYARAAGPGDVGGYLSVKNNSTGTLTIERVSLASPRNIKLLGAYIVPVRGNVVGDFDGWPRQPASFCLASCGRSGTGLPEPVFAPASRSILSWAWP